MFPKLEGEEKKGGERKKGGKKRKAKVYLKCPLRGVEKRKEKEREEKKEEKPRNFDVVLLLSRIFFSEVPPFFCFLGL